MTRLARWVLCSALLASAAIADPESEIRALIEEVQHAETERDPDALLDRFDLALFFEEVQHAIGDRPMPESMRIRFERVVGPMLFANPNMAEFRGAFIRKIHVEAGGNRGFVVLDHRARDGQRDRYRWFVAHTDQGWRFYEIEISIFGIRSAPTVGALWTTYVNPTPEWTTFTAKMQLVQQLLLEEDFEAALAAIPDQVPEEATTLVRAMVESLRAAALCELERWEEALDTCHELEDLLPESPANALIRAFVHVGIEKPETALIHARKYEQLVGESDLSHWAIGAALLQLDRRDEAVAAHQSGLKLNPDSIENLWGLAAALPAERRDELVAPLRARPDPEQTFKDLAAELLSRSEADALDTLVYAYDRIDPSHIDVAYYRAQACYLREQYQQASAVLAPMLERVRSPEELGPFATLYVDACFHAGNGIKGYGSLPEPMQDHGFTFLAALIAADDAGNLKQLLVLRILERNEPDPLLQFWTVVSLHADGQHLKAAAWAEKHERAIRETGDEQLWRLDHCWIDSLLALGRYREALDLARAYDKRLEEGYYILLVRARIGEVRAAIRAFERCMEQGYDADDLYNDDDLGPLLRDSRFRDLHRKYPPPPEEESD